MKLCCGCKHFNPNSNGCRRKIREVGLDPVHGTVVHNRHDELKAHRERNTWFGCGATAQYWSPR